MYICNCNALNDIQVRAAISAGARQWREVHAYYGFKPQCGSCGNEISSLINSADSITELMSFEPAEANA
ncbi:MAG: hypothetical protein CMM47_05515 [Rhodospirillaceae bacterium]|nr:hypothetical protein [Rhodospirillaceae bacterium]